LHILPRTVLGAFVKKFYPEKSDFLSFCSTEFNESLKFVKRHAKDIKENIKEKGLAYGFRESQVSIALKWISTLTENREESSVDTSDSLYIFCNLFYRIFKGYQLFYLLKNLIKDSNFEEGKNTDNTKKKKRKKRKQKTGNDKLDMSFEDIHFVEEKELNLKKNSDNKNKLMWLYFNCQLFIDSHINLAIYTIKFMKDRIFDSCYTDPFYNKTSTNKTTVEQYYPNELKLPYSGNLPDFIPIVDSGNIWWDVRPVTNPLIKTAYMDGFVSAMLHLFGKSQGHRCQVRGFSSILNNYITFYPSLLSLYIMIVEVSLLGNYPNYITRPNFKNRLFIVDSFNSILSDSYEGSLKYSFRQWMKRNSSFIYYMTREFYIYLVKCQGSIEPLLKERSKWDVITKNLFSCMEQCREVINDEMLENVTCFDDLNDTHSEKETVRVINSFELSIKKIIENGKKELLNLKAITKLKKAKIIDKLYHVMNQYGRKEIDNAHSNRSYCSFQYISKEKKICMVFSAKLESLRYDKEISIEWLYAIGLSDFSVKIFTSLYYNYNLNDLADNAVPYYIHILYIYNPEHFHYLRAFLKLIITQRCYSRFLPENIKERQYISLRRKYRLLPHEELPKGISLFCYCSVCEKWSHAVSTGEIHSDSKNIYARGFKGCVYDLKTGRKFCEAPSFSTHMKQLLSHGLYKDRLLNTVSIAKSIRKHKEIEYKCSSKPLVNVDMLGKVISMGGKLWALCEFCCILTEFTGYNFNANGFTCVLHRRVEKTIVSSAEFTNLDQINIKHQKSLMRDNENDKMESENSLHKCEFCENYVDSNNIKLFDTIKNGIFTKIKLCINEYNLLIDKLYFSKYSSLDQSTKEKYTFDYNFVINTIRNTISDLTHSGRYKRLRLF